MAKEFGLKNTKPSSPKFNIVSLAFIFCVGIVFSLSILFDRTSTFLSSHNKIDLFKENLQQVAVYFLPIDKQFSKFLVDLDVLIQSYIKWDNVLVTQSKQIDELWAYTLKNKNYLKKLWFTQYEQVINLVVDLWKYKDTVFSLLWKNQPYNYLVILQNTNEKRPNGWFFWSFAFVTMDQWHIKNLEIIDSYYPDFVAPNTRIIAPQWAWNFLSDRKIGYIAGNKFWFTDVDGKNLKDLYEKIFNETYDMAKVKQTMDPALYEKVLHQNIKWVIFIRSDMIEKLLPGLQTKIQEWQFLNASVDILRWQIRGNKKEMYIKEVKQYFDDNKATLFKNIVNNFAQITLDQWINIWLSNWNTGLNEVLQKYNLSNTFSTWKIYARDTNVSFDKVDAFITKTQELTDANNRVLLDQNWDILPIANLPVGDYTLKITYELNVPESYMDYMHNLEKKYNITLTDREKWILALQPTMYIDPQRGNVRKRRESKSTIYFPQNISIIKASWDIFYQAPFTAPFANGLFYQMWINKNNTSKSITITFHKS